jgi:hypothetical protein
MRPTEVAERVRGYFRKRFRKAWENEEGAEELAEALIELQGLIDEEAVIGKWSLPSAQETISRIAEAL